MLDRLFGEPPARFHPVVWFGRAMRHVESATYHDTRAAGALYCGMGTAIGCAAGLVAHQLLGRFVSTAAVGALAMAGAMLEAESTAVADLVAAGDIIEARARVGNLVGRDTESLTESEIARAAVESLVENTVDAVTATMFWASVAGPAGAAAHRCINTMDAMVGHRTERYENFGWASARLDDLANWLPSRLTAAAVMVVSPRRSAEIMRIVRRDANKHPSPNGGVVESAFAAALHVRLGGSNTYGDKVEHRGVLGDGVSVNAGDIDRTARLAQRAGIAFAFGCALGHNGLRRLRVGT